VNLPNCPVCTRELTEVNWNRDRFLWECINFNCRLCNQPQGGRDKTKEEKEREGEAHKWVEENKPARFSRKEFKNG